MTFPASWVTVEQERFTASLTTLDVVPTETRMAIDDTLRPIVTLLCHACPLAGNHLLLLGEPIVMRT